MLLVAVARSSSDGIARSCVRPVLRMTSCFHTMGPMYQDHARRNAEKKFSVLQLNVKTTTVLCLGEFTAPGAKSAIYDCFVNFRTRCLWPWLGSALLRCDTSRVGPNPTNGLTHSLTNQDSCPTRRTAAAGPFPKVDDLLFIHSVNYFLMISFLQYYNFGLFQNIFNKSLPKNSSYLQYLAPVIYSILIGLRCLGYFDRTIELLLIE